MYACRSITLSPVLSSFLLVVGSDVIVPSASKLESVQIESLSFWREISSRYKWNRRSVVVSGKGTLPFPVCIRIWSLTQIMTSVTQFSAVQSRQMTNVMRYHYLFIRMHEWTWVYICSFFLVWSAYLKEASSVLRWWWTYRKTSNKRPRHLLEHGPRNPGI